MLKPILLSVVFLVSLVGCASEGARLSGGGAVTNTKADLLSGELRLRCGTSCSGAWGMARTEAKKYYDNALWADLAELTARIGFASDLSYLYLGRAAEGLGNREAAATYYRLGNTVHRCAGRLVNNCDGIDVPVELSRRLAIVSPAEVQPVPASALALPAAPPPSTADTSALPGESAAGKTALPTKEPARVAPAQGAAIIQSSGSDALSHVRVIASEFSQGVVLNGKEEEFPDPPFASSTRWRLASSFTRTSPAVNLFGLVVTDTYVADRFKRWASASNDNSIDLELKPQDAQFIQSLSNGGRFRETFILVLPKAVVEDGSKRGMRIQIRGRGGETMLIRVSSDRFSEILAAQKAALAKAW